MDPTLALHHAETPALITLHAALLPGMAAPTIIPLQALPPAVRAQWVIADAKAPLSVRVAAALDIGRNADAWALLRRRHEPITTDVALSRVLSDWLTRETTRLGLPSGRTEMIDLSGPSPVATSDEAVLALTDVRTVLSALAWPRWLGPVLVVGPDDARYMVPTLPCLSRPVLPVIRLEHPAAGRRRRADAAGILALVALDLSAPPIAGWPAWLRVGCAEVAKAVARGEGPSPRAMLARRQHAGAAAMRALFTATEVDPALAMAVCAPLLHSQRRHLLGNLLEPLRHDTDAESAIAIAYGLSIDALLTER